MSFRAHIALAALAALGCSAETFVEDAEDDVFGEAGGKADSVGAGAGPVRVVEVLSRPVTPHGSYVEVQNTGDEPVDLEGWRVSFSRRRVGVTAAPDRSSVVAPGGLALIVDDDADLDAARIPAAVAVLVPTRDLGELLTYSQRLILRDAAGTVVDRADASAAHAIAGLPAERRAAAGARFAPATLGATPGTRGAAPSSSGGGPPIRLLLAGPGGGDDLAAELVAFVDAAEDSVDAALYQLGDPAVVDAFLRAAQRGVRVRVATDTRYYTDPDYAPGYAALVAAGATVVDDKRSARMHDKFVVADGTRTWTGSYNPALQEIAGPERADNALIVDDAGFAAVHTAEVEDMLAGRFGKAKTAPGAHDLWVDGVHVEVRFSPTGSARAPILREVARARDAVHFCAFAFFQDSLGDAMIERAAASVDVRGVFDYRGTAGPSAQYPRLTAAGLDVRRPGGDQFLHHKVILVDHATSDPVVITGSYNFSDKADQQNDEALYLIHDRALAAALHRAYAAAYQLASGPNTQTDDLAPLVVSEVAAKAGGAAAFVELVNVGGDSVDLDALSLSDHDGARVPLTSLLSGAPSTLAPGAALALRPGSALLVEPDDALAVFDDRGRIVTTFDAPRWPGQGLALARADLTAPDHAAAWAPATPTPGACPAP